MSLKEPQLHHRLFCVTANFPFRAGGGKVGGGEAAGGRSQSYLTSLGDGVLEAGVQDESV